MYIKGEIINNTGLFSIKEAVENFYEWDIEFPKVINFLTIIQMLTTQDMQKIF